MSVCELPLNYSVQRVESGSVTSANLTDRDRKLLPLQGEGIYAS
jgi:hypothetical protein